MTRHLVEVLTFEGCPNAAQALRLTGEAAARLLPGCEIRGVRIESAEHARRAGFMGSPSIRIDGEDIEARGGESPGLVCRIYGAAGGVPPLWMIEAAMLRAARPRHILFLCVANSARSQMAEGIARRLAPPDVMISSAGSSPSKVRPEAIAVLAEIGIDISGHRSKPVDEIDAGSVDAVITLCAEEVCPAYLGPALRVHWGLPDPAAAAGNEEERLAAFRRIRDELMQRLRLLFRRR